MDMTLRVSSSHLKAKLGQYLKAVRAGKEIVVTDRDQPVARLLPCQARQPAGDELPVSQPRDPSAPALGELEVKAIRYQGKRSTSSLLAEDRTRR